MITFAREPEHVYTMNDACGVMYQGELHFFGGDEFAEVGDDGMVRNGNFHHQHFAIETRRSGRMVKMTQNEKGSPLCFVKLLNLKKIKWS